MGRYWAAVVSRAHRDTYRLLGLNAKRLWISFASFAAALALIRWISGATQMSDEAKWGIAIGVAAAATYVPLFLYNFVRAPDRIDKEKSDQIKEFENKENMRALAGPLLFFEDPYVIQIPFYTSAARLKNGKVTAAKKKVTGPYIAKLVVRNNPSKFHTETQNITDAHVTLHFYNTKNSRLLFEMETARWGNNPQPNYPDSPSSVDGLKYRDLKANNSRNEIDLCLKFESDESCYAFNVNTVATKPKWKDEDYAMPPGDYVIRVKLFGLNLDEGTEEQWIKLVNKGSGSIPLVEKSAKPSWVD